MTNTTWQTQPRRNDGTPQRSQWAPQARPDAGELEPVAAPADVVDAATVPFDAAITGDTARYSDAARAVLEDPECFWRYRTQDSSSVMALPELILRVPRGSTTPGGVWSNQVNEVMTMYRQLVDVTPSQLTQLTLAGQEFEYELRRAGAGPTSWAALHHRLDATDARYSDFGSARRVVPLVAQHLARHSGADDTQQRLAHQTAYALAGRTVAFHRTGTTDVVDWMDYDVLTGPWRRVFGDLHPYDPPLDSPAASVSRWAAPSAGTGKRMPPWEQPPEYTPYRGPGPADP